MTENEIEFLQQENERLKNEVSALREKEKTIHAEYKKQILEGKKDRLLTLLISSKKTKLDTLHASVRDSALKDIIADRLAADSAELTVDDAGKLILRKKDGTNFFGEDHRLLTPETYFDRLLALDNIAYVSDKPGQGTSGKHTEQQAAPTGLNNNGGGHRKTVISTLVNEALQGFAAEPII